MIHRLARAAQAAEAGEQHLRDVPSWVWDGTELPIPIERIAEDLHGFLVEEDDLRPETGHAYVSGRLKPERRRILVDRLEAARSPGRRRFTIAHELGHWVLHPPGSAQWSAAAAAGRLSSSHQVLDWMAGYGGAELEANQFAAATLMPARLLAERLARPSDHEAVCDAFEVSPAALTRRIAFLRSAGSLCERDPGLRRMSAQASISP